MGVAQAAAGSKTRRRRPPRRYAPMAEINVTPFVDVMLVLLIIFMVTAPLLTVGVPIDLPETQATSMEGVVEPITISVGADGRVFLQDAEIDAGALVGALQSTDTPLDTRIYVRGDRNAGYGAIMQVMGRLNAAGYRHIGLVTLEETDS
jgi:biopolymer transport protein TolR